MRFIVRSESRGRIRVHADIVRMSLPEADVMEYLLHEIHTWSDTCKSI